MVSYNKISKEDLQYVNPNTSDYKAINKYKLDEYIELYNLYRKLLTQYLFKKLNLKAYDDRIDKSNLNFKPTRLEDMDLYQFFSANILKYLYIRNNIYIERLSEEELDFLRKYVDEEFKELDDNLTNFVERTFQKVIFEDVGKNGEKCDTFFGPNSSSFIAENNAVIIGMRYDEFYKGEIGDNEWGKQHDAQIIEFLPNLFYEIEVNAIKQISNPIYIIKYNEFSIKKRDIIVSKDVSGRD